jgi:hypothetical protein
MICVTTQRKRAVLVSTSSIQGLSNCDLDRACRDQQHIETKPPRPLGLDAVLSLPKHTALGLDTLRYST